MASMTIRNLSDDIKQRLRIRAAEQGHSMEEEPQAILLAALIEDLPPVNLVRTIHDIDLHPWAVWSWTYRRVYRCVGYEGAEQDYSTNVGAKRR